MSRTLKKIIQSQGKRAKGTGTTTQPENNDQSGSNYIPTNNHFKCKWLSSPIKRHRVAKWIEKIRPVYTRDSLEIWEYTQT